jgi:hypothetical protein
MLQLPVNQLASIRPATRFANLPCVPTLFAYFAKTMGHPAVPSIAQMLELETGRLESGGRPRAESGITTVIATRLASRPYFKEN